MTDSYQRFTTTLKVFGLLLFTMATSFCSYGQEDNLDDIDGLLDELFFNDQQFLDELIESDFSYNFIYTSVSYNNNTYFSGRDVGTNQFNVIPQVSYYHSSGFNASISGIYYQEFSPNWDFTSLSLGYFNTLGEQKMFVYNLGYTKYFYTDGYDGFTNSIDLSFGVRNKKRNFGTTISASYVFGTDVSYQVVSNTFVNFTLKRISNFAVRLRPAFNFIIAKQSLATEKIIFIDHQRILETVNFNIFDILNTQINIPISVSTKSWDFEFGYHLNFPNAVLKEKNLPTTSFFSLSLGYLFDLQK
tara:strand:+ start:7619 stop:8524 length:906 start_codon:yes stop_codon:yes gene_type:complete